MMEGMENSAILSTSDGPESITGGSDPSLHPRSIESLRKAVVDEARSWLGTPFKHGAMEKGKGVDCAKFGIVPYKVAGVIAMGVRLPHQHRDWIYGQDVPKDYFRNFILSVGFEEMPFQDRQPADVVTFLVNNVEAHVSIVDFDIDFVIHAQAEHAVRKQRVLQVATLCNNYRHKELI